LNTVGCSIASSSQISLQADDNSTFLPKLSENEIVKGKVLRSFSLNSVLLLIKGKNIIAKTHIPLMEGSVISLKVEEVHPNPILKLLGTINKKIETINTSIILTGLKKNLWKTIFENIDHYILPDNDKKLFKELVDDISKKLFLKPNPDLLRELLDKSGIGWEAKLRKIITSKTYYNKTNINELITGDLKGLGSKILSLMEGRDDLFEKFISTIKNVQLLNQLGLKQERKIFIPFPLQFPDNLFSMGQLLIHLNENKKEDDEKENNKDLFRISFLLEMSNLGPLRADLVVRQKQINGRFLIVEEKAKIIIEKQLPSLIKTLENKGFVIPNFECHMKKPFEIKDSLIKEIIHKENHNINLVA
jgi:Flagellar hook-length control protein FliK